jgi:hypothetical protein
VPTPDVRGREDSPQLYTAIISRPLDGVLSCRLHDEDLFMVKGTHSFFYFLLYYITLLFV